MFKSTLALIPSQSCKIKTLKMKPIRTLVSVFDDFTHWSKLIKYLKWNVPSALLLSLSFIMLSCFSLSANNTIKGNIFLDENENGLQEASELVGIADIRIKLYDANEILVSTITSNESGSFQFNNIIDDEICRLEFELPESLSADYSVSQHGENNNTAIQFVQAGSIANLALRMKDTECIPVTPSTYISIAPWGETTNGTLLDNGIAAATCSAHPSDSAAYQFVFGLMDVRAVETEVDPIGPQTIAPSYPNMFHHPDWTATKLGNVFGLTLDEQFNMYVTSSSQIWQRAAKTEDGLLTQAEVETAWRYGEIGGGANDAAAAGTIYKINATTGEVSVFAQLPQQITSLYFYSDNGFWERNAGPGLGNIAYEAQTQSFYVTNFEDGKIYHLNNEGRIISTFDPFESDDNSAGFASFDERIWAVDVYDNRVYFSDWRSATLTSPFNGNPSVYSVALDENGVFVGEEQLEFEFAIHGYPVLYSPISDIEINEEGKMLIAQRTMLNNVTVYNHQSAVALYELNSTDEWEMSGAMRVGHSGPSESYGGVAWDAGRDLIWTSSADINDGIGPHGLMGVSTNQFSLNFSQATEWAVVPYTPEGYNVDIKGFGGDVAIANLEQYNNCAAPSIEVGNYIWEDLNNDGLQNANEVAISNVRVQLFDEDKKLIGFTVSDVDGQYYFNKNNVDVNGVEVSLAGTVRPISGEFTGLNQDQSYFIVVGKDQTQNNQMTTNGRLYQLTINATSQHINSDGVSIENVFNGLPFHRFETKIELENNHNYDFGFQLVEPLDFEAKAMENSYAKLEWNTLQEVNSDYFEVQRSLDQTNWEKLDEVSGAGFQIGEEIYTLNDNEPYIGISYYRIKWFDFDGSYKYSEVRRVEFIEDIVEEITMEASTVANNGIHLEFNGSNFTNANVDLYRTDGALIWRKIVSEQISNINVNGLAAGTYVIVANINDEQKRFVQKIIVL